TPLTRLVASPLQTDPLLATLSRKGRGFCGPSPRVGEGGRYPPGAGRARGGAARSGGQRCHTGERTPPLTRLVASPLQTDPLLATLSRKRRGFVSGLTCGPAFWRWRGQFGRGLTSDRFRPDTGQVA